MESYNGILCWTRRVVEADIDLRGGPGRVGRARGPVDSDPEAISIHVTSKAPNAVRIGLETGPTSTWLWTELKRLGLPVNRQRHLTPSWGGFTPTAERTVGPARTIVGELDTQTRN
jgi:hypothetical protein